MAELDDTESKARVADLQMLASKRKPKRFAGVSEVYLTEKDDHITISTSATDEKMFVAMLIERLSEFVFANNNDSCSKDRLDQVLSQVVPATAEIICKLRGYKSAVYEHRVLVAGDPYAAHTVINNGHGQSVFGDVNHNSQQSA